YVRIAKWFEVRSVCVVVELSHCLLAHKSEAGHIPFRSQLILLRNKTGCHSCLVQRSPPPQGAIGKTAFDQADDLTGENQGLHAKVVQRSKCVRITQVLLVPLVDK